MQLLHSIKRLSYMIIIAMLLCFTASAETINKVNLNESGSFSNLTNIDKDANDLNQLNRKLQVEKVAAEIRKLKNIGDDGRHIKFEDPQTTVTGVAINPLGKKIAWLRFTDGGELKVNIGSNIGQYKVLDITMSGVRVGALYNLKTGHYSKTLFLKRNYASNGNKRKAVGSYGGNNTVHFTPSPIFTSANDQNGYVPPIVPLNGN